jgi:myo-inositol 2-dehydrogenase/D-chiro-inositol 1-dehydrogenase
MRVALLGAGRMAAIHAASLAGNPDVTRLFIFDEDRDKGADLAERVGAEVASSSSDALQSADAAVIATSTAAHTSLIHACLDRRIPMFCEKPIDLDLERSRLAVRRVTDEGGVLQVGFQRRFDPAYREARRQISEGALGRIYCFRLAAHDRTPPQPGDGGILRDLHIHDFDIVRFLFGDCVRDVFATARARGCPGYDEYEGVDTAGAVVTLENGIVGVLTGTRYNLLGYDVRAEIFGSQSSLSVGLTESSPLRSSEQQQHGTETFYRDFEDRFIDAYRAEMGHFVGVAQGRADNVSSGVDGHEAMRIAVAAELSLAEKRPVSLDEIPAL